MSSHFGGVVGVETMSFALIASLRPRHWIKNWIVFAAPFFGWRLNDETFLPVLLTFLAFCSASSCCYIWNDLRDIREDSTHLIKKKRPIASGRLPQRVAIGFSSILLITALALGAYVNPEVAAVILLYLLLQVLYSLGLKRIAILEVLILSSGFVLRAVAGAVALSVPLSGWFSASIALLALFLGLGKRRSELARVQTTGVLTRKVLEGYSDRSLQVLQALAGIGTISVYSLWGLEGSISRWILITAPLVAAGILRAWLRSSEAAEAEAPETLLYTDRVLFLIVTLWVLSCYWILSGALEVPG